jgi:hypothetical protein
MEQVAAGVKAGILAVHFGKKTIKNTKDVIISVMTAGVASSLFYMVLIIVFLQFLLIESVFSDELFLYEELLAVMIFLHGVLGLSITIVYALFAGVVYALVKGVPVGGRNLRRRLRCPQCGRQIEKHWLFCPYCRCVLEEDTRIYDTQHAHT